ncbi:ATP-dependent DNA helicase sgs1 [Puccinia graminis f. sp. tritici]|uniref:ATP-dependent DNA helicase sgs1 n=1 Tax=Puccinia graminis f. sp. tritici TaxID=56615 RepID=A0A5B0Q0V9_PUCGR|nr:ATP-dependent DNA helicase sgs1 [Puccinia graminis f. sp. tritici]
MIKSRQYKPHQTLEERLIIPTEFSKILPLLIFTLLWISLKMGALNPDIRADADIRSQFQRKFTSASAGGYPPATRGFRF